MIQANELRIGNWVNQNAYNVKNYIQVDGYIFWHYMFPNDDKHIVEISKLEPIPLTPEILIDCGFENVHTEYCETYVMGRLQIEMIPDGTIHVRWFAVLNVEPSYFLTPIEYLHQLQNLYYSLTNSEIKINL